MLSVDDLDLARSVAPTMRESVTSTSVFVHVEATRAAAGLGLLPCFMADRHPDLVRLLSKARDAAPPVTAAVAAIKHRMREQHKVLMGFAGT